MPHLSWTDHAPQAAFLPHDFGGAQPTLLPDYEPRAVSAANTGLNSDAIGFSKLADIGHRDFAGMPRSQLLNPLPAWAQTYFHPSGNLTFDVEEPFVLPVWEWG